MENWRRVWRVSAPLLPTKGLQALRKALEEDDPRLLQGATTDPPPLVCVQDWDVEGACAWTYCGWQDGLQTVAEAEEFFARLCYSVDQELGEPAGCRWFLNWADETPRHEMRKMLLEEVEMELTRRAEDN